MDIMMFGAASKGEDERKDRFQFRKPRNGLTKDAVFNSLNVPPHHKAGVIKLPFFGGIKQYKSKAILTDFPYDSALFGLLI